MADPQDQQRPSPPSPTPCCLNVNHSSSVQILRQAGSSFRSNLVTFLFLSLLLFAVRTSMEAGSLRIAATFDRDPAFRSLFSGLDVAGKKKRALGSLPARRRNDRSFLQFNRVRAIEDGFFSGDGALYGYGPSRRTASMNGSFVELGLKYGGTRIAEMVGAGFGFRIDGDNKEGGGRTTDGEGGSRSPEKGDPASAVLPFLILSGAYGWMLVCYVMAYSCVVGIAFVACANGILCNSSSPLQNAWGGGRLGMKKILGFLIVKSAVRDSITHILGLWYFGGMEDAFSFFKLIVRLKLMPLSESAASPWLLRLEEKDRVSGFMTSWFVADNSVAFILSLNSWITILDSNLRGRDVMIQSCCLLSAVINQALLIKFLEILTCGSSARSMLGRVCGEAFALAFQSAAEVYFNIASLILYISARCNESRSRGRRFEKREIESVLDELR